MAGSQIFLKRPEIITIIAEEREKKILKTREKMKDTEGSKDGHLMALK